MKELEEYCKKRGIIGINFMGKSPKQIMAMLSGKMGDKTISENTKRTILYG